MWDCGNTKHHPLQSVHSQFYRSTHDGIRQASRESKELHGCGVRGSDWRSKLCPLDWGQPARPNSSKLKTESCKTPKSLLCQTPNKNDECIMNSDSYTWHPTNAVWDQPRGNCTGKVSSKNPSALYLGRCLYVHAALVKQQVNN